MKKLFIISIAIMLMIPSLSLAIDNKATVFNPKDGTRKEVSIGDPTAFNGGYLLETSYGYTIPDGKTLGFSVASGYDKRLSRSITSSASTIYVTSTLSKDGHQFTMADFGSKVFLTIEPGGSKEEIVMCTGVTSTTWTGCSRGLAFYGTSTTAVSANQETHSAGSRIIMSNVHYVYEQLIDNDTDQTLSGSISFTGTTSFSVIPTMPTTVPTDSNQVASKAYVDTISATTSYWIISGNDIYYSTGGVSIGTSTNPSSFNGTLDDGLIIWSNDAGGDLGIINDNQTPDIKLMRSNNNGALSDGDLLGRIYFYGHDGNTRNKTGALIQSQIDGSVSIGQMPGNLGFYASNTLRMIISPSGNIGVGTSSPMSTLSVDGTSRFTGSSTFEKAPESTADPISDNGLIRKSYHNTNTYKAWYDVNPISGTGGAASPISADTHFYATSTPGFTPRYFESIVSMTIAGEDFAYDGNTAGTRMVYELRGDCYTGKVIYKGWKTSASANYLNEQTEYTTTTQNPFEGELVFGEGTFSSTGITGPSGDTSFKLSFATTTDDIVWDFFFDYGSADGAVIYHVFDLSIYE